MRFLLLISALIFLAGCYKDSAKPIKLQIVHVNDIHSHLDEEPIKLNFDNTTLRVDAGGYPRLSKTIKNLTEDSQNTLILNAGDALQGTLYYTLFKGEVDAKMMNGIGYDAFVLGNHEFDDGDGNLKTFLDELNTSIIAANVIPKKNDVLFKKWQPYIIRYFDGEAVAVIGIDNVEATKYSSNPSESISFFDEIQTTQKYVKELEDMGINKIIVLSHFGYENDINLSEQVSGIDIIVGGHTHTVMGDFEAFGIASKQEYPKEVITDSKKTCIVQAGSFSKFVGNFYVSFDKNGEVLTCKGTPILTISDNFTIKNSAGEYEDINSSFKSYIEQLIQDTDTISIVQKDTYLQNILQDYKEKVDEKKREIINTADTQITHIRIPTHDYGTNIGSDFPLGSEVAPIVAKAFYIRVKTSDAVILNAGGVRTNINQGDISIDTAYTLLPFSNTLYSLKMSGDEIHSVLEDAMANAFTSDGSFAYAYGLRYDVDMREIKSKRIKNLEILDKASGKYQAIQKDKIYNITTISYLASGKDGYTTFAKIKDKEDTYYDYANSFVVYLKALHVRGESVHKLSKDEICIKSYVE